VESWIGRAMTGFKADVLPTLDLVHLASQTGDDIALRREILALFIDQSPQLLSDIEDSASAPKIRADLAHKLKGSASAIGAFRLAAASETVETALRVENVTGSLLLALRDVHDATLAAARRQLQILA
jgi:HPt (histidine-containing phosphotransfer) domain-containing protein